MWGFVPKAKKIGARMCHLHVVVDLRCEIQWSKLGFIVYELVEVDRSLGGSFSSLRDAVASNHDYAVFRGS